MCANTHVLYHAGTVGSDNADCHLMGCASLRPDGASVVSCLQSGYPYISQFILY